MAVCSKEGVDNLAINGVPIVSHHILDEDDLQLEVLDFSQEQVASVKSYFTEDGYIHLQRQGLKIRVRYCDAVNYYVIFYHSDEKTEGLGMPLMPEV